MTQEEMDKIDRLLAEGLMGWFLCSYILDDDVFYATTCQDFGMENDLMEHYHSKGGKFILYAKDWYPTRKISQAFLVIEEMKKKGWKWLVPTESDEDTDKPIYLTGFYQRNKYVVKTAVTIELSICQAAPAALDLKAGGIEI